MHLEPIGTFHCEAQYPYDAARQPAMAEPTGGHIVLEKGHNYEQALQDIERFSHIWLLYVFHHNPHWKPMVRPPRASSKVGVFASCAPYRPNPLGLSCVELIAVQGLILTVGPHDLLDGTPILDIKPYLPYADSVPEATCGWVEEVAEDAWEVCFALEAERQLAWLERAGVQAIRAFLRQQLSELPFDQQRKRIRPLAGAQWEIAYRTWRIEYGVDEAARKVVVQQVRSAYTEEDLLSVEDRYQDKAAHRAFRNAFRT
ncbi:MAG: hypothetical protein AMXMBFR84_33160 [Candidatus Hydrogenedentota bacterium]